MIGRPEFVRGLVRVATAFGRTLDDTTVEVYAEALAGQATAQEWESFTRAAVAGGRWRFFPVVTEMLDGLRAFRGERSPEVEAAEAYERVLASGTYTEEGGTTWSFRGVKELCGVATAEAFLAAGGDSAFRSRWDEARRRERFINKYAELVRCNPRTRLLETAPSLSLTLGDEGRSLGQAEAACLLRLIGERVDGTEAKRAGRSQELDP